MSISLTELVREFAQSAVALDRVCARAGHDLFLEDSDFVPDPNSAGHISVPQTETVMLNGSPIDVPTASLRDQHGLQAKTFKLSVASDVQLEGHRVYHEVEEVEPAGPQQQLYEPICTFGFQRGSRSNGSVVGFDVKVQPFFGGLTSDPTVSLNNASHVIAAVFYVNTNHRAVMRVAGNMSQQHFANARLRVRDITNSARDTTLVFNQGNWDNSETYGSMYWANASELAWLSDVALHGAVEVSILTPASVEEEIESELSEEGTYRSEVLVTFRENLLANSAHLTLEVEFERQDPSEGVALVNDRMNQNTSEQLS